MQRNGQKTQVRNRVKKTAVAMRQVWGIGKERFGGDWGRSICLFDRLAWTVMGYGDIGIGRKRGDGEIRK